MVIGDKMKTEVFCPHCKKKYAIDVIVRMNPYVGKDNPPMVSEVGINKYYQIENDD